MTIVVVIHQPRYEIIEACDALLLLGKGGRTVYMGPTSDALGIYLYVPVLLNTFQLEFFIRVFCFNWISLSSIL